MERVIAVMESPINTNLLASLIKACDAFLLLAISAVLAREAHIRACSDDKYLPTFDLI